MTNLHGADVTGLLKDWSEGRRDALDRLFPLIYQELRTLARRQMARERSDHTLQATALVHEAFARLVDQKAAFHNRAHFLGIAAQCMRRVLIDYARRRNAGKRPPRHAAVAFDVALVVQDDRFEEVLAVHEALERLQTLDARQAKVAELRYFGGMENGEIAQVLGISAATVKRDWTIAKLWLRRALRGG